jgi:predicted nucleic acid-binding protein
LKVLIDSSTLYSYLAFDGKIKEMLDLVIRTHEVCTTDYIIEEIKQNLSKKTSSSSFEQILEHIRTYRQVSINIPSDDYIHLIPVAMNFISAKDSPILACALLPDVDVLITSDSEFHEIDVEGVLILTPRKAYDSIL